MSGWRDLAQLSRPSSWLVTGIPFLAAALVTERAITPAVVLGALYFFAPYGLLRDGLAAIDAPARADGTPVTPEVAQRIRIAIAVTNLPLLILIVLASGGVAGLGYALAALVAVIDGAAPLRTRDRPVLDVVTGSLIVVLPAVCGFLTAGLPIADLPWLALVAFLAWGVAAAALRAIGRLRADPVIGGPSIATTLGPRATAMVSLVGFLIAAAGAATHGSLGALAALGLDLYLLLPAMVLLARRTVPGSAVIAGARAWAEFRGLTVLVGGWLVLLLLRHRDLTPATPWEVALLLAGAATTYALLNVLVIRLATRRRRARRSTDPDDVPAVTIVVPCRDEAARLEACLSALIGQTYADATILVVDDGSTDGSPDIAADLLGTAGQVVIAPAKPDDWTGKRWACQIGAEHATGDLILFVDADTVLVPVALRILVEQLTKRRLDLLSGITRFAMPSRGERIGVPGFGLLLFGLLPIWLTGLLRGHPSSAAFAYGPLMLVRRDVYLAAGGHGAAPGALRDDIDLARAVSRSRGRVGSVHAADLGATRLDPADDSTIGVWRRITVPNAGGTMAPAIALIAIEALAYVVPMLLPPIALIQGLGTRLLSASVVPLLILVAMRIAMALTQRQPFRTVFWHPVTIGVTIIGQLAAIVDHVIGRAPRWRGRIVESTIDVAPESAG